jgi:hypothetical protein
MCDRTPDNARQEMLHARRLFMLNDAPPGATRPGHPSSRKVAEVDTRV